MNVQVNLRLPSTMLRAAKNHVKRHGYKNVQDFITETVREKLFPAEYERVSPEELNAIRRLLRETDKEVGRASHQEAIRVLRDR